MTDDTQHAPPKEVERRCICAGCALRLVIHAHKAVLTLLEREEDDTEPLIDEAHEVRNAALTRAFNMLYPYLNEDAEGGPVSPQVKFLRDLVETNADGCDAAAADDHTTHDECWDRFGTIAQDAEAFLNAQLFPYPAGLSSYVH